MKKIGNRVFSLASMIFLLVIVISVSGCSSGNKSIQNTGEKRETKLLYNKDVTFDEACTEKSVESAEPQASDKSANDSGMKPKLIYTHDINIETRDYESAIAYVEQRVKDLDGYIEMTNVNGRGINEGVYSYRNASYTLRIPTKKVDLFMKYIEDKKVGVITGRQMSADNITFEYYDTESRLRTKKVQEERLLEIMKKGEKLEVLLKLEQELADVRYEIDKMTSQMKRWDNLVDYTTINIYIREVRDMQTVIKNPTMGQRIGNVFMNTIREIRDFIENVIVFVLGYSPIIIILIIIGLIIYRIGFKRLKMIMSDKYSRETIDNNNDLSNGSSLDNIENSVDQDDIDNIEE